MKFTAQNDSIRWYHSFQPDGSGGQKFVQVGIGRDGELWVRPEDYPVTKEFWELAEGYAGPVAIIVYGAVHVNLRAVADLCPYPEEQKLIARQVDDTIDTLHPTNFHKDGSGWLTNKPR